MAFSKITNAELNSRGATTLPNQPTISASALKQEFDAPAKNIVAPKFNQLIDDLSSITAAADIGATAPTGRTGATVQAVVNAISSDLATLEASVGEAVEDAHTHSNKALLDTYEQTEADLANAVSKAHEHSNKSLLDTYTQTEGDLADAVSKAHTHANKALLDTYSQTEADLANAVAHDHTHSNKSILDTYTQTNADISDAVTKKHSHSNKTVLDKFSEVGGDPYYDGNPIGGGGGGGSVNNAYKIIKVASTNITASGEDTLELVAGDNVTLTPDSTNKKVTITATGGGGGTSTGDMLKSVYDSNNDGIVNSADTLNGLTATVTELNYVDGVTSAIQTQLNGKAASSHTHTKSDITDFPAIPAALSDLTDDSTHRTVTDTQISSWNAKSTFSGSYNDLTNKPTIPAALSDLTDDTTHRTVTDTQISTWNAKSDFSGSYNDLTNKPTIPTVNNATLTIQKNSANVATFTANSSTDTTANIITDGWSATATVASNNTVTFSGIDDSGSYGYKLFCERENVSATVTTKTGAGTSSMTLVYTVTGATAGDVCKLRILK